jgi:hypothetical protein
MISSERLDHLKKLFYEDGIELSDDVALEIGIWLLERVKSVSTQIPNEKEPLFRKISAEITLLRSLYKNEKLWDHTK